MVFPLFAQLFYPKPKSQVTAVAAVDNKQQVKFTIQGMTCEACEEHVNNELSKVAGVLSHKTSYANRSSLVDFDRSKVNESAIEAAINKTGYKVKSYVPINLPGSIDADSAACQKDKSCSNENGKSCCKKQ
ncbi:heavy-metal-associated domain-containing protein [Agriterribacter sp.]|uniref:heavy-metal-associated domain-containing protein n=1 Tax=Agriterribacter sp. TaxID=2821509 RepID=UPI002D079C2B|nr:heavy-metal-associated domain-containing protein [Agriterribacter sp.]HTN07587.1 heavy-metal-associated domain-containing protein [Agriterribacter sp.]